MKRLTHALLALGVVMMVGSTVGIIWTLGADLLMAEKLFLTSIIVMAAGVAGLMVVQ